MESTLRDYKSPRKHFLLPTLATLTILRFASFEFPDGDIFKQSPVSLNVTSTSLTDRHTQTNAGENIFTCFCGNKNSKYAW